MSKSPNTISQNLSDIFVQPTVQKPNIFQSPNPHIGQTVATKGLSFVPNE